MLSPVSSASATSCQNADRRVCTPARQSAKRMSNLITGGDRTIDAAEALRRRTLSELLIE
jgi:hypothetical protein